MRRYYAPLKDEALATMDAEIAELEHKYLLAIARRQLSLGHSVPALAAFESAMTERRLILNALMDMYKSVPLLATLPLVEMKANLILAQDPQAESAMRANPKYKLHNASRLYPYRTPSKPEPPTSEK